MDNDLRDHFLSLQNILERTERYLTLGSLDLLEYCHRRLEGHLSILVAFIEVLENNQPRSSVNDILVNRIQELFDLSRRQIRRIDDLQRFEETNESFLVPLSIETGGRPKYAVPKEHIERLRTYGMSWTDIANVFHISERTLYRRRQEYCNVCCIN